LHRRVDVAVSRREGRGEKDQADYHEKKWPGVALVKKASAAVNLIEKKKNPESNQDRGAHHAANRATLAAAT
jgi:hypothetical protein